MADENTLLSPHAQDVVFNKPSLKEFIRLIKNGTINAIWPSTQAEFNWWNDEGRFAYANEIRDAEALRIKSVKTSMTVYYGDHYDSAATQVLNIEETTNKFNSLKNDIDDLQDSIIDKHYFDLKEDMGYPILTLNQDTGTINGTSIIDNNDIVFNKYKENLTYIQNLIETIKSFMPTGVSENVYLSDNTLEQKYLDFFTNKITEVNNIIKNLPSFTYDLEKIKKDSGIIDEATGYFAFDKIKTVIADYKNTVSLLSSELKDFNILNTKEFDSACKTAEQYCNDFIGWKKDIADNIKELISNIKTDHAILLPIFSNCTVPDVIFSDGITETEIIDDYINGYKDLYKNLLIIQANGVINTQEEETNRLVDNTISKIQNIIQGEEEEYQVYIQKKIDIVNNEYISVINNLINSFKNNTNIQILINQYYQNLPEINFSYNPPGVNDLIIIRNELTPYYNIIKAEFEIVENYNLEHSSINSLAYYNNLYNVNIMDLMLQVEQSLYTGEDNAINYLEDALKEYQNIVTVFKNYVASPISHEERIIIDKTNKTISNREALLTSISNQYNNIRKLLNAIKIVAPGSNLVETYNNLELDKNNLTFGVESVVVESSDTSNKTDFDNWVNNNFNKNNIVKAIEHLVETIYTVDEINMSNFIPEASANYMTIANKDRIITNYNNIINDYYSKNREGILSQILNSIKTKIQAWTPIYNSDAINHYTCINVGSFIQFANESTQFPHDGSISITVDEEAHYPLINGLVDTINDSTRNTQVPTIAGLKSIFGENFDKIGNKTAGGLYQPIYLNNGEFAIASNVVAGKYETLKDNSSLGWRITSLNGATVSLQATKVFGAVYNDYAEYRAANAQAGRCVIEKGNGALTISTDRLQLGANIVSDTYGFAIGETDNATCPVAVCGRVLAYPLESKELYTPGAAVCSGPEGTVSLMSREEIKEWPDAIVGYVSEVPTYDTWGTDNIPVNGRIWIKIK